MKQLKLLVACLIIASALFAQELPNAPVNSYIYDQTGSLTAAQILDLNQKIKAIDTSSTVQIGIAIINKLPDNVGSIEDYARLIGTKWGVGNAQNGIMYVITLEPHGQRLEIGRRLEGTIPDATAKEMMQPLKPYLKSGDFHSAISTLLDEITAAIKPAIAEQKGLVADKVKEKSSGVSAWWLLLIPLVVIIALIIAAFHNDDDDENQDDESLLHTDKYDKEPDYITPLAVGAALASTSHSSRDDDYDDESSSSSSSLSSSESESSPSFGGFGGDSGFSGGGASDSF